jgi:subtilisin family serine protease
VCIALLDGSVELAHPALRGAHLAQLEATPPGLASPGAASRHGTFIASVIFGQHGGPVKGIAPRCRGVSIPVFSAVDGEVRACGQLDLARAMSLAVQHGAQVINISGGQFSPTGTASPLLETVVRECARLGILIVAAAGNDGCACLHIPAALPTVLAVGAMNAHGEPLTMSNWGTAYRLQGILAPGEEIRGAGPAGGTMRMSGTSCATAVVSGLAGLLLSHQRQRGHAASPQAVRAGLLASALGCDHQRVPDCRRLLAGRLNLHGAVSLLNQGMLTMSEPLAAPSGFLEPGSSSATPVTGTPGACPPSALDPRSSMTVQPSACACQGPSVPPQLVYALGQLDYDLISEARRDSLVQKWTGQAEGTDTWVPTSDPKWVLAYLDRNPTDATAIEWTLKLDGTPLYAVRPHGAFAAETYQELRAFLREQLDGKVERVSVPGVLAGKATLLNGQSVPVLVPEPRAMYSWTTHALINAVAPPPPESASAEDKANHELKTIGVRNFLDKVYHALRNLGIMPQERALNFAATNAFEIEAVYENVLKHKEAMELDTINVTRSPICRPGSDCWDIELFFFYPDRVTQTVRRVYRFTVDVSDVVPVTVGPMRSWSTR